MTTTMISRPEFGLPARTFAMTVGLKEGYEEDAPEHGAFEVLSLIECFCKESGIEFGCQVTPCFVLYSYVDEGEMRVHQEPSVAIGGLFPPNKFGGKSDEDLAMILMRLAGFLAEPLGQTSFHAEVCGVHYAWKVDGQMTAHEEAQAKKGEG